MIAPFPIAEAWELSTEAGWNQTVRDWERIVGVCGDQGCRGVWVDGRLVSSATTLAYGEELAWIGMVLTAGAHRGKGYAGSLLREALASLDARCVRCVKLDATDMGRPVYARLGFVEERPVSRWMRHGGEQLVDPGLAGGAVNLALDAEAFGVDRRALLAAFASDESYVDGDDGFAYGRPGRMAWHFGPCVARDADTARRLLQAFLSRHGDAPSIVDVCDEHADAVGLVTIAGYQPVRHLMRMYRGDAGGEGLASGPGVFALAGFEFG